MAKYDLNYHTDVTTVIDEPLGIVTVVLETPNGMWTGSSRLDPLDDFDEEIGTQLAYARALKEQGKWLEREAFDRVHERDIARESQREASAEAAERKREATYRFQCEFAELINLKLAQDSLDELTENAVSPAFNGRLPHPSTFVKNAELKPKDFRANLPA